MKKKFSVIAITAIISSITIFIISQAINVQSVRERIHNREANVPADTISTNVDVVLMREQIDSIKQLNEIIIEMRRELDELKRQQTIKMSNDVKNTEIDTIGN